MGLLFRLVCEYVYAPVHYASTLLILNVTDPTDPYGIGSVADGTLMEGANQVALSPDGEYAFVTCEKSDALVVIDVSVPTSPQLISSVVVYTWAEPFGVAISADAQYAYVTSYSSHYLGVADVCSD